MSAALVVVALGCLLMWAAEPGPAPSAGASSSDHSDRTAPVPDQVSRPASEPVAARAARPVSLRIPLIGVRTRLLRLGQHDDGTVEVPQDPAEAGWFRLGPPPGASGSSVILGHVDSTSGPAVFYRLAELRQGDPVVVAMDDGTSVRFRVASTTTYPNADFPARKVYGRQGRSQLNLVTCGGTYDAARGGYQANVVVHALRVS